MTYSKKFILTIGLCITHSFIYCQFGAYSGDTSILVESHDETGVGYISYMQGHGFVSRFSKWAGFTADQGYIIGMQAKGIDFTGMYSTNNGTGFHAQSNGNNYNPGDGFLAEDNMGCGFSSNNNNVGIMTQYDKTYAGYFYNDPSSSHPSVRIGHGAGGLEGVDLALTDLAVITSDSSMHLRINEFSPDSMDEGFVISQNNEVLFSIDGNGNVFVKGSISSGSASQNSSQKLDAFIELLMQENRLLQERVRSLEQIILEK